MTDINRLSSVDEVGAGDQVPVYSARGGATRKLPVTTLFKASNDAAAGSVALAQEAEAAAKASADQAAATLADAAKKSELAAPTGAGGVGASDAASAAFWSTVGGFVAWEREYAKARPRFLEEFGALGNGSDDRAPILAAIDWAYQRGGGVILGKPGARYGFTGRIFIRKNVVFDLGEHQALCWFVPLSTTGGIDQSASAHGRANVDAQLAGFVGPAWQISGAQTDTVFGRGYRETTYDIYILGARQAGSIGARIQSDTSAQNVAWTEGRIITDAVDYGLQMISNGDGYVNENDIELITYDSVEHLNMVINATGQIDQNRLRWTSQTGADARTGYMLKCDGRTNYIQVTCWDIAPIKINPAYSGVQYLFTANSGGNRAGGRVSRSFGADRDLVVDLSPTIRKNFLELDDMRAPRSTVRTSPPPSYATHSLVGDQDDMLAWASGGRYTVTTGGTTPPDAANLLRLFSPGGSQCTIAAFLNCTITVDVGASKGASDLGVVGVLMSTAPKRLKVEVATVDPVTGPWTTVMQHGYSGEPMPLQVERNDLSSLAAGRYFRLTAENDVAAEIRLMRWYMGDVGTSSSGGAWMGKYRPVSLGRFNLVTEIASDGYSINGTRVLRNQQPTLPAAATDLASCITLLNALANGTLTHGLFAPRP